jgi:hypothetical protein
MGIVSGVSPPNLPVAPAVYERRYQDQFANVLRLFFNSIANELNSPIPHGSYYDTTTQTNPVADTVNLITYDSVVSEFQIERGKPTSKIYVADTGLYNIQFSAQLDKTGGSASSVYIWPRVNGVNVPDSATKVVIDGPNAEVVPAWNFLLVLEGGDYFELVWQSNDVDVVLAAEPAAGNIPGIPSIILTVYWVSNYEAGSI